MERKIGEKFTINGKTYIVKEGNGCKGCAFYDVDHCSDKLSVRGNCVKVNRYDRKEVIFKEVKEETNKVSNMKPFNLEQAKDGKPVCTRDGRKARILCFDLKHEDYPIAASVIDIDGREYVDTFTKDGRKSISKSEIFDLMMATEKKRGWFAIYHSKYDTDIAVATTQVYNTKEEVETVVKNLSVGNKLVDIRQIEWEE